MRNMSKKTRKLIDRKVVHKYFWFDYLEGSIFYHSNHVWPARLWIGDAIDHNDDTQCVGCMCQLIKNMCRQF